MFINSVKNKNRNHREQEPGATWRAFSEGTLTAPLWGALQSHVLWAWIKPPVYSDTLITTDGLIAQQPDLILRFLRATLKGWRDVVEDYPTAVDVILKYARLSDPVMQTAMMEAMLPLVHTGEDFIGWTKPEVWRETVNLMSNPGLLAAPVDVNQAYTLRFLEEIHKGQAR